MRIQGDGRGTRRLFGWLTLKNASGDSQWPPGSMGGNLRSLTLNSRPSLFGSKSSSNPFSSALPSQVEPPSECRRDQAGHSCPSLFPLVLKPKTSSVPLPNYVSPENSATPVQPLPPCKTFSRERLTCSFILLCTQILPASGLAVTQQTAC